MQLVVQCSNGGEAVKEHKSTGGATSLTLFLLPGTCMPYLRITGQSSLDPITWYSTIGVDHLDAVRYDRTASGWELSIHGPLRKPGHRNPMSTPPKELACIQGIWYGTRSLPIPREIDCRSD